MPSRRIVGGILPILVGRPVTNDSPAKKSSLFCFSSLEIAEKRRQNERI